jgi:hypothetical protein
MDEIPPVDEANKEISIERCREPVSNYLSADSDAKKELVDQTGVEPVTS